MPPSTGSRSARSPTTRTSTSTNPATTLAEDLDWCLAPLAGLPTTGLDALRDTIATLITTPTADRQAFIRTLAALSDDHPKESDRAGHPPVTKEGTIHEHPDPPAAAHRGRHDRVRHDRAAAARPRRPTTRRPPRPRRPHHRPRRRPGRDRVRDGGRARCGRLGTRSRPHERLNQQPGAGAPALAQRALPGMRREGLSWPVIDSSLHPFCAGLSMLLCLSSCLAGAWS